MIPAGLLVLLSTVGAAPSDAAAIDSVLSAWEDRGRRFSKVRLLINHDLSSQFDRLSLFRAHWASPQADKNVPHLSLLDMDGITFRFQSARWAMHEHGHSPSIAGQSLLQATTRPLHNSSAFLPSLLASFPSRGGRFREPYVFSRVFDGDVMQDTWESPVDYPRVTVHSRPADGPFFADIDISHRLDSLQLTAALLSLHPLHSCSPIATPEQLTVHGTALMDGSRCLVLRAVASSTHTHSSFYVDPRRGFVVLRYEYRQASQRAQIDFTYSRELRPASWTVIEFTDVDDDPVRAWTRSSVNVADIPNGVNLPIRIPAVPEGSWVVDSRSKSQYIVRAGGERHVPQGDLMWQPTYDDLISTEPGAVGELLASRERWSAAVATAKRGVMLFGILSLFAVPLSLSLRRLRMRWSNRSDSG